MGLVRKAQVAKGVIGIECPFLWACNRIDHFSFSRCCAHSFGLINHSNALPYHLLLSLLDSFVATFQLPSLRYRLRNDTASALALLLAPSVVFFYLRWCWPNFGSQYPFRFPGFRRCSTSATTFLLFLVWSVFTMPTTINGVEFDLSQTNPKANTTGWTRDEREALAKEGLVKFKDSVVKKVIKTPLSSNLSVSSYKPSEMDSKNNFFYALSQWSVAALLFRAFLKSHYLSTVFTIVRKVIVVTPSTTQGQPDTRTPTVERVGDLFDDWHSLTLEDVFASCKLHFAYSTSAIEAQNMNLSWEFLLANVDQDLKASVIAEVSRFLQDSPEAAQSGPMAFYIIANRIVRSSDALAHHAVSGLMAMGLIHFKGEDVIECVAVLRNVLLFLGQKAPPTIMDTLIDVFLRCSSPVFVSFIRNLKDFHPARISTPEDLFSEAQAKYNELVLKPNGWLRVSKSKSAFSAEMPELAAVLEHDGNSSPKSDGGKDPKVEKDRRGRVIDRNPPKDGVVKRKRSDGSMEYWCAKCNRWGAHDDAHHDKWWEDYKKRTGKAGKQGESDGQTPPSMKRANFCQPIMNMLTGSNLASDAYDSDQSF